MRAHTACDNATGGAGGGGVIASYEFLPVGHAAGAKTVLRCPFALTLGGLGGACVAADHDGNSSTKCTPCKAGTYARVGATACAKCAAGKADLDSKSSTPCKSCEEGEYAAGGTTACRACPAGKADLDLRPATPCKRFASPETSPALLGPVHRCRRSPPPRGSEGGAYFPAVDSEKVWVERTGVTVTTPERAQSGT